jgi:hypothetical protein
MEAIVVGMTSPPPAVEEVALVGTLTIVAMLMVDTRPHQGPSAQVVGAPAVRAVTLVLLLGI